MLSIAALIRTIRLLRGTAQPTPEEAPAIEDIRRVWRDIAFLARERPQTVFAVIVLVFGIPLFIAAQALRRLL